MLLSLFFFPGFITRIHNYDPNLLNMNHTLILISIWQIVDCSARVLTEWFIFPRDHDKLWIPTWLRIVFIPFVMIAVYTTWFYYNSVSYLITALVAFTHGYFGTLCMMSGPKRVLPEDSTDAGVLMAFFLQLGIFVGVNLATIVLLIIEGPRALNL